MFCLRVPGGGGKSHRPEVVAVTLNYCGTCWYFNSKLYDNKTALLKSVLKTVIDPPGGLKTGYYGYSIWDPEGDGMEKIVNFPPHILIFSRTTPTYFYHGMYADNIADAVHKLLIIFGFLLSHQSLKGNSSETCKRG